MDVTLYLYIALLVLIVDVKLPGGGSLKFNSPIFVYYFHTNKKRLNFRTCGYAYCMY